MSSQEEQLRYIAHLCTEVGVVSMASVSIPFFIDNTQPKLAVLGIAVTIFFWYLGFKAISLIKRNDF